MRQRILSVTAADCRFEVYKSSKKAGGQHKDKTSSCVRCVHEASGAVGQGEDHREQSRNKKEAFRKMAETKTFKAWLNNEIVKATGNGRTVEEVVSDQLLHETVVEEHVDGEFVPAERLAIQRDDLVDLGLERRQHGRVRTAL